MLLPPEEAALFLSLYPHLIAFATVTERTLWSKAPSP